MWAEILGQDEYNAIDTEWCKTIKEITKKANNTGKRQILYKLYETTNQYYNGNIIAPSFETFYRFFVQLSIKYVEVTSIDKNELCMDLKKSLVENIVKGIVKILMRCLIQEIHNCKTCGELRGNTAAEEYVYYNSCVLKEPRYIRKICQKYPEMLRLILLKIEQITEEMREITDAIRNDKEIIIKHILQGRRFNRIDSLVLGKSDAHRGGRTVAEVKLDNGMKIIYRPTKLEKNRIYYQIYNWLMKDSGIEESTRRFLDFQTYSWEEFIKNIPCNSEKEVRNYYFRAGVQLFLCYLTYTSDIHGENMISRGEYPELIDLETMPGIKKSYVLKSEEIF